MASPSGLSPAGSPWAIPATCAEAAGPPAAPKLRHPVRLFAALVALSVVLHLPGLVVRLFNSDEASIATMAMVINHGGELYHQIADRKPPVVPYVYAGVFALTHSRDLRPVRAVGVVVLAATAFLLALEARRRYRSDRAAAWCGVLFLFAYAAVFPADSQAAGFELFMLLPMTAAFVAAGRGRAVTAGVCLAVACLCKQTAIATALPVGYLLWSRGRWRPLLAAAVPGVAVVGMAALAFGPSQFLLWTVTGNRGYLAFRGSPVANLVRGLGMTIALTGLEGGVVLLALRALYRRRVPMDVCLWLAAGTVAVIAGFRFFGHYYLQLLPPLSLMAAGLAGLPGGIRRWTPAVVGLPALAMMAVAFVPAGDEGLRTYAAVAQQVRTITESGDRILVWGQLPEVYWASGRTPATRFIHTGFLTGNSGERPAGAGRPADGIPGAWAMLRKDVAAHLPELVVDTTAAQIRGSQYYPLTSTALWKSIAKDYAMVGSVEGVVLYEQLAEHEQR